MTERIKWEVMEDKSCAVGTPCLICGFEMMEIARDDLQLCISRNPDFKSIPKRLLKRIRAFTPVCPKCDQYALGLDFEIGVPIRDKKGQILTVHDLVENQ